VLWRGPARTAMALEAEEAPGAGTKEDQVPLPKDSTQETDNGGTPGIPTAKRYVCAQEGVTVKRSSQAGLVDEREYVWSLGPSLGTELRPATIFPAVL
jgi:hypothetical protein